MSAREYVLLAEVFYLRQEDGSRKRFRTGDVVTGLNDEQVQRLLKAKAIALPEDVPAAVEPPADPGDPGAEPKPPRTATNKVLIAWLVSNAVNEEGNDYTEKELKPLNKAQLLALIDSIPDD